MELTHKQRVELARVMTSLTIIKGHHFEVEYDTDTDVEVIVEYAYGWKLPLPTDDLAWENAKQLLNRLHLLYLLDVNRLEIVKKIEDTAQETMDRLKEELTPIKRI